MEENSRHDDDVLGWPPKIDKGVKPKRSNGDWSFLKGLEIGDSFFVPGKTTKSVGSRLWYHSEKLGYQFECHNWEQQGLKGVRIWRKS